MANEKSKEVKMEGVATGKEEPKKLSYEELERIAYQLKGANNDLYKRLQNAEGIISEFNEIGMLLSILERSEHFSEEFVTRCSRKIEETVTKAFDAQEKAEEKQQA